MKFNLILCFIFLHFGLFASQTFERSISNFNIHKDDLPNFKQYQYKIVLLAKNLSDSQDELRLKLYIADQNQIYLLTKTITGEVTLEETSETFEFNVRNYSGIIDENIYDTILKDTNSEKLATILSSAFKYEFSSTKKLRVNAFYQFSVETITEENGNDTYGLIENAKLIVGKATVEKESIYDLDSETSSLVSKTPDIAEKIFVSPVKSLKISSLFNLHRKHPITKKIQPHNGIDFVAKSGTPVYPAHEGRIIAKSHTRAKGNFILIDHGNGFKTTYDHLKKFQKDLRVGDFVTTKDQIGQVGKSGFATGAHLHFAVLKDDFYVNPIYYFSNLEFEDNNEDNNTASPNLAPTDILPIFAPDSLTMPTNHVMV